MGDLFTSFSLYLQENKNMRLTRRVIFDLPYKILRETYGREFLRNNGIFFTGRNLAQRLISRVGTIDRQWKVYDPAAGAGDLLVNYADCLPVGNTVEETVEAWGGSLFATELEDDFVPLIKLRLLLLAYLKVKGNILINGVHIASARRCFRHIIQGDYMKSSVPADLILVNPPFNCIVITEKFSWGTGKMSNAAYFMYNLEQRYHDATIAAILPDVIRSGSRYNRLRQALPRFSFGKETPVGRFDKFTDVDVFIAVARTSACMDVQQKICRNNICIGDVFNVCVGSVVPYRDPVAGDEHFYLKARNVETGKEKRSFIEKIKSFHKPVEGPFITIKRTSSPSDKVRCAASLIASRELFHLDNHLIIIKAKGDMSLSGYRAIARYLNGKECTRFLNRAIRCRHLTVSIIKQIPIKV